MAVRHIVDLKQRSAAQRLAVLLLRLADVSSTPGRAFLPVAKQSLASRLGMTAATLSRTLGVLSEHGLVVRGTRIIVTDREAIDDFCGQNSYFETNEIKLGVNAM